MDEAYLPFDFPTFLWSVGTVFFFGGVLLGWLVLPKSKRNALVLWDHSRIVALLSLSLILATLGTILAFYRIGYVPLLRFDITDVRVDYFNTVGALANRFLTALACSSPTVFYAIFSRKR